ncbi:MAG: Histone deacetylase hda1 [Alyxoria varia]|nr:MAG: Histone deacetylase hda1 [Alyxoria varia]
MKAFEQSILGFQSRAVPTAKFRANGAVDFKDCVYCFMQDAAMDVEHGQFETEQTVVETTEIEHTASPPGDLPLITDGPADEPPRLPLSSYTKIQTLQAANNPILDSSSVVSSDDVLISSDDEVSPKWEPKNVQVMVPASKFRPLPFSTSKTGLVYDVRMRYHIDQKLPLDDAHPEAPSRIFEIYQELIGAGLVEDPQDESSSSEYQMLRIPARPASKEELCLVHSHAHVEAIEASTKLTLEQIFERADEADRKSIYWHNQTWFCASLSAGGAIEATRAVLGGVVKNAVAVIRPPGHHAEHAEPSGFCFFNNVPIAARVIQDEFPEQCRKILVLDWDVHHGNGTQQAFYNDPNVLYVSIHVHQNGAFYPHGDYGDHLHCGKGAGLGRNVNIPWINEGMTDADYMLAFQQVVMPICLEFDPDFVMISAGFDAAAGDPLGNCYVSPAGFAHMTHMLMRLANGRLVACLEGGYNLQATAKSFMSMTRTIMGEPPERMGDMTPSASAVTTVQKVIQTQAKFWKCLYPKDVDLRRKQELGSERLHDIIREWQSKVFWDNYRMSPMFVLREKISKSFNDQVLATSDYNEEKPVLVIFHDPPEALGVPDPRTSRLELHNTWISYVDWAVKQGFAVIDVNVPKHITDTEDDNQGYVDPDSEQKRLEAARELAFYIWDNYLEIGDSSHIFFMGIGDAYAGMIDLMKKHPTALQTIHSIYGFLAQNTLRSVEDPDRDEIAKIYYRKSTIYLSTLHPALSPNNPRRLRRRHGSIVHSPRSTLQEMLLEHREDVTEKMLQATVDWRRERDVQRAGEAEREDEEMAGVMEDKMDVLDDDDGDGDDEDDGVPIREAPQLSFETKEDPDPPPRLEEQPGLPTRPPRLSPSKDMNTNHRKPSPVPARDPARSPSSITANSNNVPPPASTSSSRKSPGLAAPARTLAQSAAMAPNSNQNSLSSAQRNQIKQSIREKRELDKVLGRTEPTSVGRMLDAGRGDRGAYNFGGSGIGGGDRSGSRSSFGGGRGSDSGAPGDGRNGQDGDVDMMG